MDTEKISIIIPVYNVERYIRNCVNSVLEQTFTNLEIILVDDGSTDSSNKICKEFLKKDTRIKLIEKENGGLSDARNAGIKQATGSYIAFVDSDDKIDALMYETLYESIKKYDADLSICNFYYIHNGKYFNKKCSSKTKVMNTKQALDELYKGNTIGNYAWNKLYKRNVFDNIEFPVSKLYEDMYIMPKIFNKCKKIVYVDKCLYKYYFRQESIVGQSNPKSYIDYLEALMQQKEYADNLYHKQILSNRILNWIIKTQKIIYDKNCNIHDKKQLKDLQNKCLDRSYLQNKNKLNTKFKTFAIKRTPLLLCAYGKARAKIKNSNNSVFRTISNIYLTGKNK